MNTASAPIAPEDALAALRGVMDPELNCNVVDLGLIYDVQVLAGAVRITMTLTSPGCPLQQSLVNGVSAALSALPGVNTVDVDLVWDPPWNPEMLSAAGRAHLGVHD